MNKYNFRFIDTHIEIDLTLEMVLNRLNGMYKTIDLLRVKNTKLNDDIFQLQSEKLDTKLKILKKNVKQ